MADYSKVPTHSLEMAYRAVQGSLHAGNAKDREAAVTRQAEMSLELRKRREQEKKRNAEILREKQERAKEKKRESKNMKATSPKPPRNRPDRSR